MLKVHFIGPDHIHRRGQISRAHHEGLELPGDWIEHETRRHTRGSRLPREASRNVLLPVCWQLPTNAGLKFCSQLRILSGVVADELFP